MMGKIMEHFISGFQKDCEKLRLEKEESAADSDTRKKQETKLNKLLSELIETERKYVMDLEEACSDYLPIIGENRNWNNPDRKKLNKIKRIRSHIHMDRKKLNKIKRNHSHIQIHSESLRKTLNSEVYESMPSGLDQLRPSRQEIGQILGNIEDIKDYHKKVLLPKMEEAMEDSNLIRTLFQSEHPKLSHKYSRYCINYTRSSIIIEQNIKFFSLYQFNKGLKLRVDGMLIKPIQRLTRYHMFLNSISKTCKELGFLETSKDFAAACDSNLSAASHTNIMMWIGKMDNCPLDLSGQGQLLKHGKVLTRSLTGTIRKGRKWSTSSQKPSSCHLFLFQQTVVLCRTSENCEEQNNPHLYYSSHISVNQVRVRDTIAEDLNTFEVHKLERVKLGISGMREPMTSEGNSGVIMRLECQSEENKNVWVRAINNEVKQLRSMARNLSSLTYLLTE